MYGKLGGEIMERIEAVARVETFLILAVAALDLAIVAWCIWADQFVPDAHLSKRGLK